MKYFADAPYFDDYGNVENENYIRILYRPGRAVQARELTQMQTMLQSQIDKFGRHIFKDGSRVLGGLTTFDNKYAFVKCETTYSGYDADDYVASVIGSTVTGQTSGVTATVVNATISGTDPFTLFVKYTSAGTNNTDVVFAAEEVLIGDGPGTPQFQVKTAGETPTGFGCSFHIDEGVYFIASAFVMVEEQSIIVSKYSNTASARVVFIVSHNIITSADDPNLVDNANGSPNYTAPGASRYQIALELAIQDISLAARDENDIIQLGVIVDGIVQDVVTNTTYSEIMKTLAQRTFEESGNYSVRPFEFYLEENDGDDTKFDINIDPSVAYVSGYRIENKAAKTVTVNKARAFDNKNNVVISAPVGNYVLVNNVSGIPDIDTFDQLTLKDSGSSDIGFARCRGIEYVSGTIGTAGAVYRVYLFDIQMTGIHLRSEIAELAYTGTSTFSAQMVTDGEILGSDTNSLIFPLPFNAVKTLYPNATSDIDMFYYVQVSTSDTPSSNVIQINAPSDSIFASDSTSDWIVINITDSNVVESSFGITLSSGNTVADVTGLNDAKTYAIRYVLRKNIAEKSKSLQANTVLAIGSPNTTPGDYDSLGKADVVNLVSVTQDSPSLDITDRYELDNGQRENFYGVGRIRLKPGEVAPTGAITVVFDYYSHGIGDYFSVDSYPGSVDYSDIPSFKSIKGTYRLSEVLDFRPRINDAGTDFTGTGASVVDAIDPSSIITCDVEYYLPRRDKVYVTSEGVFDVKEGIPSLNPQLPTDPENSMVLYTLFTPAYTHSTDSVSVAVVENKRYTMRDIGKLDQRITNLEYYTTLSMLEVETANRSIFDDAGNVRFKNGFVVDGFHTHAVADVSNSDHKCALDKRNGVLRPHFHQESVRLLLDDINSSDIQQSGSVVTLPYTEEEADSQPLASSYVNLNPYYIFKYDGTLDISPSTDEWKDIEERPTLSVDLGNGYYDAIKFLYDELDIIGTDWNSWQTDWTGVEVNSEIVQLGHARGGGITDNAVDQITTTVTTASTRTGLERSLFADTTQLNLGNRVVSVDYAPSIRSRKIYFKAQLMKPNTRVYLFLDGVDISAYASTSESFTPYYEVTDVESFKGATEHPAGVANLVTDANGTIEGSFIIPNNDALRFKTGSRVLRLTDSPTNNLETETTSSDTVYEARGLIQTTEGTALSVTTPKYAVSEVSESRVVKTTTSRRSVWDPVAQSFTVNMAGGMFLTSIDVFFQSKDTTHGTPVTLQIRTMENGIPTKVVLPFSEVVVYPTSITTSADGSVATNIAFTTPVYVKEGEEYAVVLIAQNTEYNVFVSELGQFDLADTDLRITDQPHLGSLFLSQNGSTWSAQQFKDLKFTLYRAEFDNSTDGVAQFENAILPVTKLATNPFMTYNGSTEVRVFHRNHGLFDGSSVTIAGVGATLHNIPAAELNDTHTISEVEMDSYVITVTTSADATGRVGGSTITATGNVLMNAVQLNAQELLFQGTTSAWSIKSMSGQSLPSTTTPYIAESGYTDVIANETHVYQTLKCVPSEANEAGGNRGLFAQCVLHSDSTNLSPVVDLNRLSVIAIANRIDNPISEAGATTGFNTVWNDPLANVRYVDETAASGNSALSRYITRKIELSNPADDLKLYIDASKPSDADITVYYKLQLAGDDTAWEDLEWTELPPDSTIPADDGLNPTFTEIEYSADGIGTFQSFGIKIVMTSTNSSAVPQIKNLRAIALSS